MVDTTKKRALRVWKTDYNYVVAINKDCYEMNMNADLPNGVCIYLGSTADNVDEFQSVYRLLDRTDYIPIGILNQVCRLMMSEFLE